MGKSKRKVLWQEGYIQVFVDEKGIISREEHSHDFGYSYQPLIDTECGDNMRCLN